MIKITLIIMAYFIFVIASRKTGKTTGRKEFAYGRMESKKWIHN
jgi:hypothetical protein